MASIELAGAIHFERVTARIDRAVVHVRLLDVSLADAPSTVVAETVIRDASIDPAAPGPVPFSLRADGLDERADYSLMVHVDVDGSGSIAVGDYLTMETFPVSLAGPPRPMVVRVRPVG